MKLIRDVLDSAGVVFKKNKYLKRFYAVYEATDEFFFGTDKTTRFSPHILDGIDIKRYISFVIVALIPAAAAGVYFYGLRVVAVILVSYAAGGLIEVAFSYGRKKPIHEGFLATGLIFPLILPPTIPLWMVAVGSMFGVFFGKEVFGGTGRNIFNPALVGRVFLSLAFPEYFTTMWNKPFSGGLGGLVRFAPDAVTAATPLIDYKTTHVISGLGPLFFGTTAGSIGETFRLGILIGGVILILVRIADWRVPLTYLGSVVIVSLIGHAASPEVFAPPAFQLLSGGLLFGAFFMATDPVTSPLTLEGKWVYGAILGVLTVLIRGISGFAEGVMFAILIMNAFAPLIDTVVISIRFRSTEAGSP